MGRRETEPLEISERALAFALSLSETPRRASASSQLPGSRPRGGGPKEGPMRTQADADIFATRASPAPLWGSWAHHVNSPMPPPSITPSPRTLTSPSPYRRGPNSGAASPFVGAASSPHVFYSAAPSPAVRQHSSTPTHASRPGSSSEVEALSKMLRLALEEVKQLTAAKQSMQFEHALLQDELQEHARATANKDVEIQRLLVQREVDIHEKAEQERKLNDAIEAITAIKLERNETLDGLVTNQADEEIARASEREERARLALELSQVTADLQKATSERDHLQWCLEKEREQREESETALRQFQLQRQLHGDLQELQRQSEHNKERSKTMARSLAAVLQEKDSLQRRNKELERAVTPGFESHAGTPTAHDDHSIPWMSGRGSPSIVATDFPVSVRHQNGISPPHAPPTYARGIDRLPPRSPSMARASYQSAGSPVNQARMSPLSTFGTPPPLGSHRSPSPFHAALVGNGTPPHYLVTNKIEPGTGLGHPLWLSPRLSATGLGLCPSPSSTPQSPLRQHPATDVRGMGNSGVGTREGNWSYPTTEESFEVCL